MTAPRSGARPPTTPAPPGTRQSGDLASTRRFDGPSPVSGRSEMSAGLVSTIPVDAPPTAANVQVPAPEAVHSRVRRSRFGGIWIGVIVAAVVLVILLVFVLQNTATMTIHFLGYSGGLPIAVALLLAAICGILLVAIPGTVRIVQLRKAVRSPTGSGPNGGK